MPFGDGQVDCVADPCPECNPVEQAPTVAVQELPYEQVWNIYFEAQKGTFDLNGRDFAVALTRNILAAAPATRVDAPAREPGRDAVLEEAALAIEAENARTMEGDYMLDSKDCADVVRELKSKQEGKCSQD